MNRISKRGEEQEIRGGREGVVLVEEEEEEKGNRRGERSVSGRREGGK